MKTLLLLSILCGNPSNDVLACRTAIIFSPAEKDGGAQVSRLSRSGIVKHNYCLHDALVAALENEVRRSRNITARSSESVNMDVDGCLAVNSQAPNRWIVAHVTRPDEITRSNSDAFCVDAQSLTNRWTDLRCSRQRVGRLGALLHCSSLGSSFLARIRSSSTLRQRVQQAVGDTLVTIGSDGDDIRSQRVVSSALHAKKGSSPNSQQATSRATRIGDSYNVGTRTHHAFDSRFHARTGTLHTIECIDNWRNSAHNFQSNVSLRARACERDGLSSPRTQLELISRISSPFHLGRIGSEVDECHDKEHGQREQPDDDVANNMASLRGKASRHKECRNSLPLHSQSQEGDYVRA